MQAIQRFSRGCLVIAAILVVGCGSGRLTTRQAGEELQPLAALPEREQAQLPHNLLIRIENVADDAGSYKNYATLRINGREIAPDQSVSNFTSRYDYALRLPYGIYEIEGEYHVVGFWKEVGYPIRTDEPVKVMPGKKTVVTARIQKNWNGTPVEKKLHFALRYEELPGSVPTSSFNANEVLPVTPSAQFLVDKKPVTPPVAVASPAPVEERIFEKPLPRNRQTVLLQINTTPSNAEVIVDDRFCGNSPLRITVTRGERHVVQVSRPGHDDLLRIIEPHELGEDAVVQMVFKLEKRSEEAKE
jgi:hypothetical protein